MVNKKRLVDVKALDERDVKIIIALAENRINVSDVSRIMFMHRNTVVYHIEKIKRITGYDPMDFFGLCKLVKETGMQIDDAPTVDAAPVMHGRWEQVQRWATKAKYRCSVCGREVMSATKVNIEKYPYCHCGAKMDGGVSSD